MLTRCMIASTTEDGREKYRIRPGSTAHKLLRFFADTPGQSPPLSRTTSADVQVLADLTRAGLIAGGTLTTIGRACLSVVDGGATMVADMGQRRAAS